MKKNLILLLLLTFFAIQIQAQVNWSDDVACIIYSHCSSCHTSTGIAPFNLESYDDAYNNRYAIQSSVSSKSMPPWPPNQAFNPIAHANVLSQEEIDIINDWVSLGAPEGDPMTAPESPIFTNPEEITEPDYVVELPEYTVPASNGDLYKCFVIPTNIGEDKNITSIEIIPGNRNIVHHILMFQDISNEALIEDQNDPTIGYTCFGDPGTQSAELVAGWAPGSRTRHLPDGMAVPLPNGANIIVQVHYPNGSEGETDQSKINLKFSDVPNLRPVYNLPILNHYENIDQWLYIPANEVMSFHEEMELPIGATGISVAPHAHLICTSMRLEAELPNGDILNLIDIPEWDFNWQGFYDFKTPAILPQGTKLHGYATYDNTVNNPNNPNDPPQAVSVGESTTEEMMVFYVSFTINLPGDENLVFDNEDHHAHHNDCTTSNSVGIFDLEKEVDVRFYPNPIKEDILFIEMEEDFKGDYQIELTDITGRKVADFTCNGNCEINIPTTLSNGIYFCRILENANPISKAKKIVIMR
jgi:hypothetical protein